MILLDRLIQISDHILNKEIVIESMGELGGSFIEIPNNNHLINHPKWDYFVRTIHIKTYIPKDIKRT